MSILIQLLMERAPNGHPRFNSLALEEMILHSAKNKDYAGGGDPLGNFKRRSKILALYPGLDHTKPEVVAVIDTLKQLDAALWLMSQGREGEVEGVGQRLGDISIYAKLIRIMEEGEIRKTKTPSPILCTESCCVPPPNCGSNLSYADERVAEPYV